MRNYYVQINDDKTVELNTDSVGYVEESNATQLVITLNTELQAEDISYHVVCFRHGENDEKMVSQKIYPLGDSLITPDAYSLDGAIYINLPQYVTRYPIIYAQIEGHILKTDIITDEKYLDSIIKSPVFLMKLDESIVGNEGEFNTEVDGIFSEIQELKTELDTVMPVVGILKDGLEWEDIVGYSKPSIQRSDGDKSLMLAGTGSSYAGGSCSVTIGENLIATGENTILVGKNGETSEGVIFAVANGSDSTPRLMFEIGDNDAIFHALLYGVTPELSAAEDTIPTLLWIKNYIAAEVISVYNEEINTLQEQINTSKPCVSGVLALTSSGWIYDGNGKYTQTVLYGVDTDKRNEIDVEIESVEEWGNCFVLAIAESNDSITFEANEKPTDNLYFRVTSTEVNYAV